MQIGKKHLIIVGIIVAIIFVIYSATFFSNTCPYDGLTKAHFVAKYEFDSNFSNLDLNIGDGTYSINKLGVDDEKLIREFAEKNYVAYETHDCKGSSYYIRAENENIMVSEEKMLMWIKQTGRSIMIGTAKGKLVLQQF